MRQVVLDTETTGLEPELGHRVIEIGAVELVDRQRTGRSLHHYLDPERDIDEGALEVHGITREFLADKPRFAEVVEELLEFIDGAELVIHNAPFDLGFLDYELGMVDPSSPRVAERVTVVDTLEIARDLHPGQRNNLDALCKRYEIDNSSRQLHGALLDAEILAEVYLAMTGGQVDLGLSLERAPEPTATGTGFGEGLPRPPVRVLRASREERGRHEARLAAITEASGRCLWRELEEEGA